MTLVLQAVVFGAAHANYPAQPAWARMVEIAIPFTLVGLAYAIFGLLPVIVLHFAFDVVFFAMPLFASSAPGIVVDRVIVIALALVPLFVVLVARLRGGAWGEAPAEARNAAFTPPEAPPHVAPEPEAVRGHRFRRARAARLDRGRGLVGAPCLLRRRGPAQRGPSDSRLVGRSASCGPAGSSRRAASAWRHRGGSWFGPWATSGPPTASSGSRAVPDAYRRVMGTHIEAPHWLVRLRSVRGDVVDRAEEYLVHVGG